MSEKPKQRRGFASMNPDKQREIARLGGQSQGKESNAGNFAHDRERAAAAGRKGGLKRAKNYEQKDLPKAP